MILVGQFDSPFVRRVGVTLIDSAAILDALDEIAGPSRALVPACGALRRRVLKATAMATGAMDKAGAWVYGRIRPSMIFIDSNIPMYLVGAPRPHKVDAQRLLENLLSERVRLVTYAEVLLEILHRYVAIDRRDAIQPAFDAILGIIDSDGARAPATAAPSRSRSLRARRL